MGGSSSRRKKTNTPMPTYSAGLNRSVAPLNAGIGNSSPYNRDQQRELMQANQTIANLTNQIQAMQRGGSPVPYGGYSQPQGYPPAIPPYGGYSPYGPPSPLLENAGRFSPYLNRQMAGGVSGYRDTDFAAVASIAGLSPDEVALLHREYMNLTRGGTIKMDRSIFRQLLRDVLMVRSNDYVDRAIERVFLAVDRNHDGHIDFSEFVGAFKDVLKGGHVDSDAIYGDSSVPDILTQEIRASGFGSGAIPAAIIPYRQQSQVATQLAPSSGLSIVPLASTGIQQVPLAYGGVGTPVQFSNAHLPLMTLDQSQSSYVIATPGQYLITQPTALQCVPLPMA